MEDQKTIKLPSGAELRFTLAPFSDGKALWQAFLKELKGIDLDPAAEIDANFYKSIFCAGFSSVEIEACLWKCMARCLYNGKRIDPSVFEPVEARDDFMTVCFEVAKENITPFTKSLYARYSELWAKLTSLSPA